MLHFKHLWVFLFIVLSFITGQARDFNPIAVIHCQTPGTLQLSHEAQFATTLKVTGNINACDFQTLKRVTINVTRELDLSEATIHSYTGTNGCYVELADDWFITDSKSVNYPAHTLPIDAFTEERDNSLSKWREGSSSLQKIILPNTLTSIMPRSIDMAKNLEIIEIAPENTELYCDGHALYNFNRTVLLGIVPTFYDDLILPASLTAIADGVFDRVTPASVTFKSTFPPSLGQGVKQLKCAYITAPSPDTYKELFSHVDCTTTFDYINVNNVTAGNLTNRLAEMGYKRADLRALRISGNISEDEITWLMALPNLHKLDLSSATVSSISNLQINGPVLTDLSLPSQTETGMLTLCAPYLKGKLTITEGIYWLECSAGHLEKVTFPSSLTTFYERSFNKSPIREVDFSQCTKLTEINGFEQCALLKKVKLPPFVEKIKNFSSPIAEMELPASLKQIEYCSRWEIEELILPESLEDISLGWLPVLKKLDASQAINLHSVSGFSHCPMLKEADFSHSPINSFNAFNGEIHLNPDYAAQNEPANSPTRIVITGGTRNPAKSVCAIASVKLPPTLQDLYGFRFCDNLKTIDLDNSYQLTNLTAISDCPALTSVSLPYSITSVKGFNNCNSLTQIRIASTQAPTVAPDAFDGDLSHINLVVPNGYRSTYMLADKWENCKSITEGGYVVSFQKGLDDYHEMISGLGMYPPGATVTLHATTLQGKDNDFGKIFEPTYWWVTDVGRVDAPTGDFTIPEQHVICTPFYSQSFAKPVMEFEINALTNGVLRAANPSYTFFSPNYNVFLDGEWVYLWTPYHTKGGTWELSAGKHNVKIYGAPQSIELGIDNERNIQEFAEITSFDINKYIQTSVSLGKVNLNTIHFKERCILENIDIQSGRLETLNLSNTETKSLFINDCGLRSIQLGYQPTLWQLNLWNNELTSIDLSECPAIKYGSINKNTYHIDVDAEGYFDLTNLEPYGFDITKMSNPSHPVIGTKMLISPEHQYANAYYDYDAGLGKSVQFTLCFDPTYTSITTPEASSGLGKVILDGLNLTVCDFEHPLKVYKSSGTLVATVPAFAHSLIQLPTTGFYILRCGSYTRKLAVK